MLCNILCKGMCGLLIQSTPTYWAWSGIVVLSWRYLKTHVLLAIITSLINVENEPHFLSICSQRFFCSGCQVFLYCYRMKIWQCVVFVCFGAGRVLQLLGGILFRQLYLLTLSFFYWYDAYYSFWRDNAKFFKSFIYRIVGNIIYNYI